MTEALDKIITARVRLQRDNPFFSFLAMALRIKEGGTKTCGVDGVGNLYYNPEFIMGCDKEDMKTLLSHEVLHVALLHLNRVGVRDRTLWNVAVDVVVNNSLINNDFRFGEGLKGGIIPVNNSVKVGDIKISDIDKKVAEEVYDEIVQAIKKKGKKKGKGTSEDEYQDRNVPSINPDDYKGFDEHNFNKGSKQDEQIAKAEKEWIKRLTEAVVYAKQQGKLPAGMDRYVDEILDSKLNWREILYRFITKEIPFDFTYSSPSKKSISSGFYMPSVKKEQVEVTVAVDVSGSVGNEEMSEFLGEVVGIGKSFDSVKMNVVFWDTQANNHYVVDNGSIDDILSQEIKGGGGTDFTNIYEWVKDNVPQTKILVFLTDGYSSFAEEEVYRTLWVLSKSSVPMSNLPYGECVKISDDE